jgi:hypothetical protein
MHQPQRNPFFEGPETDSQNRFAVLYVNQERGLRRRGVNGIGLACLIREPLVRFVSRFRFIEPIPFILDALTMVTAFVGIRLLDFFMAKTPAWALSRRSTTPTLTQNLRGAPNSSLVAIAIAMTIFSIVARPASAQEVAAMCANLPLASAANPSSQIPSPCTVPAGGLIFETLYYQNASHVGGTALAAYPMLQMAAGVAPRMDVVFDPPSQVAESGPRGEGLYLPSHSSYGLRYRLSETTRIAFTAGFAVVPPASLYAPSETQPKYRLNIASGYRLTNAITIKGIADESTSHSVGVGHVLPGEALGADIAPVGTTTVLSTDIGLRTVAMRTHAQSFSDVCLKRSLNRKLVFDVGLGTTFNSVANSKAHYLSTGLSFRP